MTYLRERMHLLNPIEVLTIDETSEWCSC